VGKQYIVPNNLPVGQQ